MKIFRSGMANMAPTLPEKAEYRFASYKLKGD